MYICTHQIIFTQNFQIEKRIKAESLTHFIIHKITEFKLALCRTFDITFLSNNRYKFTTILR